MAIIMSKTLEIALGHPAGNTLTSGLGCEQFDNDLWTKILVLLWTENYASNHLKLFAD